MQGNQAFGMSKTAIIDYFSIYIAGMKINYAINIAKDFLCYSDNKYKNLRDLILCTKEGMQSDNFNSTDKYSFKDI